MMSHGFNIPTAYSFMLNEHRQHKPKDAKLYVQKMLTGKAALLYF